MMIHHHRTLRIRHCSLHTVLLKCHRSRLVFVPMDSCYNSHHYSGCIYIWSRTSILRRWKSYRHICHCHSLSMKHRREALYPRHMRRSRLDTWRLLSMASNMRAEVRHRKPQKRAASSFWSDFKLQIDCTHQLSDTSKNVHRFMCASVCASVCVHAKRSLARVRTQAHAHKHTQVAASYRSVRSSIHSHVRILECATCMRASVPSARARMYSCTL